MTRLPSKQVVIGVGISKTSYESAAEAVRTWVAESRSETPARAKYICVTSVHGIITARGDAKFRSILNEADIVTPDGMPIVWAMRSFGVKNQARVYGPDLMLTICERAAQFGHRLFFYGAKAQTLEDLQTNLKRRFPGLQVVGQHAPPFRPLTADEDEACVQLIQQSKADIVFVGLSTPKQERWMAAHGMSLAGKVMIGVGAGFDFHAGCVRQAPLFLRRAGLEWLFRLMVEPKRLWRRYLLITPRFLPLWALQKLGLLRFSVEPMTSGPNVVSD